jgi:hypothetical protein
LAASFIADPSRHRLRAVFEWQLELIVEARSVICRLPRGEYREIAGLEQYRLKAILRTPSVSLLPRRTGSGFSTRVRSVAGMLSNGEEFRPPCRRFVARIIRKRALNPADDSLRHDMNGGFAHLDRQRVRTQNYEIFHGDGTIGEEIDERVIGHPGNGALYARTI